MVWTPDVEIKTALASGSAKIEACGQPNDAHLQFIHFLRRFRERERLHHHRNLALRTVTGSMGINIVVNGSPPDSDEVVNGSPANSTNDDGL